MFLNPTWPSFDSWSWKGPHMVPAEGHLISWTVGKRKYEKNTAHPSAWSTFLVPSQLQGSQVRWTSPYPWVYSWAFLHWCSTVGGALGFIALISSREDLRIFPPQELGFLQDLWSRVYLHPWVLSKSFGRRVLWNLVFLPLSLFVYTCMWRPEVDVRNHHWSLFYLIHGGRVC